MKNPWRVAALLIQVIVISGCAQPDRISRINSTTPGLFFTVETHHAHWAMGADFTWIYAHFEANGRSDKKLVLDGEYLEATRVIWINSREVKLCVPEGYTESFRNYVTLDVGGVSDTIHTYLDQQCSIH